MAKEPTSNAADVDKNSKASKPGQTKISRFFSKALLTSDKKEKETTLLPPKIIVENEEEIRLVSFNF